jgi:hypothetical protein
MDELMLTEQPAVGTTSFTAPPTAPHTASTSPEPQPTTSATSPGGSTAPPTASDPRPGRDEIPITETPAVASSSASVGSRWQFGRNELLALGGFAILGLISTVWFFRCLFAHPAEIGLPQIAKHFSLPIKGQLATLTEADSGWRHRVETDRVRAEEVVLPTLRVKIDPSRASQGFLRVEFIDTEGKIRGDIATVEFAGGRFKDSGRGEKLSNDGTEITVSGTVGFNSHSLFTVYLGGEETRWSVRLREGADYSNGPWSLMGQAQVSDRKP